MWQAIQPAYTEIVLAQRALMGRYRQEGKAAVLVLVQVPLSRSPDGRAVLVPVLVPVPVPVPVQEKQVARRPWSLVRDSALSSTRWSQELRQL